MKKIEPDFYQAQTRTTHVDTRQRFKVRPCHLLYLLALSLPFSGFPFLNLENRAITWDWIITIGLIAVFLVKMMIGRGKQKRLQKNELLFWLLVFNFFLLVSCIGPVLSGEESRILDYLTTWPQYVLFSLGFLAVSALRVGPLFFRSLVRFYLAVAAVVAVFGMIQVIGGWLFNIDLYLELTHVKYTKSESGYSDVLGGLTRASSIFEEPRIFGTFLVIPFFVVLRWLWEKPASWATRAMQWLLCLIFLGGILLTFSISTYFGLAVGLVLFSLIFYTRWWEALKTYGYFIAGVIVFFAIFQSVSGLHIWHYLAHRFYAFHYGKDIFQFGYEIGGVARYIRGALLGMQMLAENPVIGIGLNQLKTLSPPGFEWVRVLPPFMLFASVGLLGSISFGVFFLLLIAKIWRIRRLSGRQYRLEADLALLLATSALVLSVGGGGFNYQSSIFWFAVYVSSLVVFNWRYWRAHPEEKRIGANNLSDKTNHVFQRRYPIQV